MTYAPYRPVFFVNVALPDDHPDSYAAYIERVKKACANDRKLVPLDVLDGEFVRVNSAVPTCSRNHAVDMGTRMFTTVAAASKFIIEQRDYYPPQAPTYVYTLAEMLNGTPGSGRMFFLRSNVCHQCVALLRAAK